MSNLHNLSEIQGKLPKPDWIRVRATALYASGDGDPYDNKAGGFDAIMEDPQIAGADTSYWIRQAVPLIGGGGVALSQRNGFRERSIRAVPARLNFSILLSMK